VAPCALTLDHNLSGDSLTAIQIYTNVLRGLDPSCSAGAERSTLQNLTIVVENGTVLTPTEATDETFDLEITAAGAAWTARLNAKTYVGVLRGLETFVQLIVRSGSGVYSVPYVPWFISEAPSFKHRGLLLDPARTFIPMQELYNTVDALLYSKMNVLHLHLSDSQAIPLELPSLPKLSTAAAYSAAERYNASDIAALVQYARLRGVRVVPELDTPGHARAWGLDPQYSDLVACADVAGGNYAKYCAEPPCGQLNPAAGSRLYSTVESALRDVAAAFPDERVHLGYDEVNMQCWEDDVTAAAYMQKNGLDTAGLLKEYYTSERTLFGRTASGRKPIFYEEVALQNLPLQSDDAVQVWSDHAALRKVLDDTPADVIVSWSSDYYLDCGRGNMFGGTSWCDPYKTAVAAYTADPLAGFSTAERGRALGGEACLWGELVSPTALMPLAWPRAAGYGGRLWSYNRPLSNTTEIILGLQGHADRFARRGLATDRVTTRFCVLEPWLCFGISSTAAKNFNEETGEQLTAIAVCVTVFILITIVVAVNMWYTKRKKRLSKGELRLDPSTTAPLLRNARPRHSDGNTSKHAWKIPDLGTI